MTTDDWTPEARPVPAELDNPALNERLSVLRGFKVADHLEDREIKALMEAARGGIGEPTTR